MAYIRAAASRAGVPVRQACQSLWPRSHPRPGDTKLTAAGSRLVGLLAPGADGGDACLTFGVDGAGWRVLHGYGLNRPVPSRSSRYR
jgi:hypothetical protein